MTVHCQACPGRCLLADLALPSSVSGSSKHANNNNVEYTPNDTTKTIRPRSSSSKKAPPSPSQESKCLHRRASAGEWGVCGGVFVCAWVWVGGCEEKPKISVTFGWRYSKESLTLLCPCHPIVLACLQPSHQTLRYRCCQCEQSLQSRVPSRTGEGRVSSQQPRRLWAGISQLSDRDSNSDYHPASTNTLPNVHIPGPTRWPTSPSGTTRKLLEMRMRRALAS